MNLVRSLPTALPVLLLLARCLGATAPYNTEPSRTSPLPATEVAARIPLPPGFRGTVFAAEPEVQQPIGIATDPRGRLWVAENYTYSEAAVGYHPELRDRIVVFEDADQDGRADRRRVFWDGAQRLTSVEVGLGGVWALCLPDLVFIPDADGNDVPDGPPQVRLTGFESVKARHTVANGLRWGPDGWLYGRQGILGTSRIGAPGTPENKRATLNVGIWRYHPIRGVFEIVAHGTTNPWGMDWDARGEGYFINTVIGHLWQLIPGAHYRRMFGADPDPHVYELIDQHADHVHWATGETWTDVRPRLSSATSAAGGGHAHTGLLIYQGGQWPARWDNQLLTINLHGRRLNVERLDRDGSGIVARHVADAFPFGDSWFRGVDLLAAPDGGVFVSDWSDTGECHDHDGIHRTSGRIFHLGHGPPATAGQRDLTTVPDIDLVQLQTSPNDWLARQSRRVLADRAWRNELAPATRGALQQLALVHTNEVFRLRALWSLHVAGGSDPGLLAQKLAGTESERVWALRLWEDARHTSPAAATMFRRWVNESLPELARLDPSPIVRLAIASLLQKLSLEERLPVAEGLLSHAGDNTDHNLPLMIWYGIEPLATQDPRYSRLIAAANIPRVQRLGARRVAEEIDTAPGRVDALLQALVTRSTSGGRQAVLEGITDGLAGRRQVTAPKAWTELQRQLSVGADESMRSRLRDLNALFGDGRALDELRATALDKQADLARRRAALLALIDARVPDLRETCVRLLPVRDLSAAAAQGLAQFEDPKLADLLIAEWPKLYGHERPGVMNSLLTRPTWAGRVVEAIAEGRFRRADLGVFQVRQIRSLRDATLTRRLTEVWGELQEPDETARQASLRAWRERLAPGELARANITRGRDLYAAACGACHRLYGTGGSLGPELTGAGRQNLEYLLENLLFPSAVVPAEFRSTTLTLKDGRVLTGIVRSRAARTRTLAMVGDTQTLDVADLVREETSTLSLMPEGILEGLSVEQARDLIAYLMSTTPPGPE